MIEIIREATVFEKELIKEEDIEKVIAMRKSFRRNIEKGINQQYKQDFLMIDTKGRRIGQANGLATYTIGEQSFGRPVKITATTYKGQGGVVNIEQQAGLSGNTHTKGIQILTGFLGSKFAQEMPLSLCCNICFEQSYGMVDGDSASSTQLYAVLSSLAGVPLSQGVAVTGSINQYGCIQPVGGVNEKIEGFYSVCKEKGLTGRQGVIIPYQNKIELLLEDEVVEAVRQRRFHVYAIKDFKEGMEILTEVPYEKIEQRVQQKLMRFNDLEMMRKVKRRKT
jgi:Lon-like ATP-dependent protease